jgi:hypothetical protein
VFDMVAQKDIRSIADLEGKFTVFAAAAPSIC